MTRSAVANIIVREIDSLQLKYPEVTDKKLAEIEAAKKRLEGEQQ